MDDVLKDKIIKEISTIYDPEIPVNIYDLGLIYEIKISEKKDVFIKMTLTTPNCPEAQYIPGMVHSKVSNIDEVRSVNIEIVWDPPWDTSLMSETARMALNMV